MQSSSVVEEVLAPSRDESLFSLYRRTDSPHVRERLIERHLPLARRLARRYARSRETIEDLEQVASLGLVKAVDRFDPDRGIPFPSFAIPTIVGELKRHLRDTRWAIHAPRDLQELAQRVERELDRETARLRRPPSARELANAVGVSVEQVLEARAALAGRDVASLEAPVTRDAAPAEQLGDLVGAHEPGYRLVEERAAVEPGLVELSERDRLVLRLRFVDDMTQSEIGERLGISQMQVSRLLRRSLECLRADALST